MIKSIELINYESHKHSKIELVEGMNVIKGENDQGKSSFTRAIEQIACNPVGDDYISKWCKDKDTSKVIIEATDGNVIEKERGKNINKYILNEDILEAFGREVPKKIKEVLNVDNINIQFQEDPAFMLSSNSGQIARFLNQLVDLDIIDLSHSNIEKRKREVRSNNNTLEKDLKVLDEKLLEYENLNELEDKIKRVEKLDRSFKNSINKQKDLVCLIKDIKTEKENLIQYRKITKHKNKINQLQKNIEEKESLEKEQKEVIDILQELKELRKDRRYYQNITKLGKDIEGSINNHVLLEELEKESKEIKEIIQELKELKEDKEYCKDITRHRNEIDDMEIILNELMGDQKKYNETKEILNELITLKGYKIELKKDIDSYCNEIKEIMPDICPLCEQEIAK